MGSIVSFLVAALSGMGIGGGGLLVIYLSLVMELPQYTAQGINLLFFLFSSASSLSVHMQKRKLFWPVILVMSISGMIASPLGALTAKALPSELLRKLFGGVLIVSGVLSLRRRLNPKKEQKIKKILP